MYREDGLPAGTVVEGIEIQRLLRADRFVLTYLARDVASGRSLAVKEYLPRDCGRRRGDGKVEPQTAADAELYEWGLKRFLAEAHFVEQLAERDADRHLVRVERVIEDRGTAYVALEYEAVRTLEESTTAGLPEARVREVLSSIEAGLEHMHASGLYHYDVTPSNVLVRADGTTALLFACGRTRQEMARRCRTAAGVFSPGYAAAEQYDLQEGQDGPWTDIHALGALAYWALSGQAPESVSEQAAEHRLLAVRQASEEGVSDALASALARDVRARPQSVEEWRLRLTPHGPEPVAAPWARWAMASALVVLLGLVATWAVVERQLREQAEADFSQAQVAWGERESELNEEINRSSDDLTEGKSAVTKALDENERLRADLQDVRRLQELAVLDFPACGICPSVVMLPEGTFTMGNDDTYEGAVVEDGASRSVPVRPVEIGLFALGRTEVTRAQYRLFELDIDTPGSGRCRVDLDRFYQLADYPMACVTWSEAKAYVDWLAEKTGRPYRLPTEAEWEYAARAGTTTDWYWGADDDNLCLQANRESDCDGFPGLARVESFPANKFGLFDMAGNVQEWVADCWHNTYEGAPSDGTARRGTSGLCRRGVARGGSYFDSIAWLRVSARHLAYRDVRSLRTGFRVALSLE